MSKTETSKMERSKMETPTLGWESDPVSWLCLWEFYYLIVLFWAICLNPTKTPVFPAMRQAQYCLPNQTHQRGPHPRSKAADPGQGWRWHDSQMQPAASTIMDM